MDDDAGLDYKSSALPGDKKTMKQLMDTFNTGTAPLKMSHHLGSTSSPKSSQAAKPSGVNVGDINLLMSQDKAQPPPKKPDDEFDTFLDSIGASHIK